MTNIRYESGQTEICQIFYTTRFSGQKFYTLKVPKLRLFLPTRKQRKCINISHLSNFVLVSQIQCKIRFGEYKSFTFMQIMQKNALYFEQFYTAGTNFTRPPVATVVRNKSQLWHIDVCKLIKQVNSR